MTSDTQADVADPERTDADDAETEVVVYHPSMKPTLLKFLLVGILGTAVTFYVMSNPEAVGPTAGPLLLYLVPLVTTVILLRLLFAAYVLSRTRYVVTPEHLRQEFFLLYRRHERQLPLAQLRGLELTRGRLETLLGYGSVTFLTGGTNQSLGFLSFTAIPDPDTVRDQVNTLADERQ
jgi:uncharacterized membrane protein YdbT with pleckstrin-like domain